MPGVTIIKRDHRGREVWRYSGTVVERVPGRVRVEAYFNRDATPVGEVTLLRGDRFVEDYYSGRWYNVDAIYSGDGGELKAWYCNIARPAEISDGTIAYDDLAIDLLVYPDGRQVVLDEDEFEALELDAEERRQALAALAELQGMFRRNEIRG